MNVEEYCDALNVELKILYYPNGHWSASIDHAMIKEGDVLRSVLGSGSTPDKALLNYIEIIRGRQLVLRAHTDHQREYIVPTILSR